MATPTATRSESPAPSAGLLLLGFAVLVILTAGELAISTATFDRAARIAALFGLATLKGALLLLAFMHLGRQRPSLRAAVLAPLLFSLVLAVILMLDGVVRLVGPA